MRWHQEEFCCLCYVLTGNMALTASYVSQENSLREESDTVYDDNVILPVSLKCVKVHLHAP